MLGYLPFNSISSINFTPEEFSRFSEQFRPVFKIRSFTQLEMQELSLRTKNFTAIENPTDEQRKLLGEENTKTVIACVVGWENLFDAGTCEEIVYPKEETEKEALYKRLPAWIRMQIMDQVKTISCLNTADALGLK
jgi:hypothetical protein